MVGRVLLTVVWGMALVVLNKVLEPEWAQLLATFVMGGIYALALSKMPGSARHNSTKA